jgi:hypothetical protein
VDPGYMVTMISAVMTKRQRIKGRYP